VFLSQTVDKNSPWPLESDLIANNTNRLARTAVCETVIDHYGLAVAQQDLREGKILNGAIGGPFLLAWSPAVEKGRPGSLMLKVDLSHVTTAEEARRIFIKWHDDIEDPSTWEMGWSLESLRSALRQWADEVGPQILQLISL